MPSLKSFNYVASESALILILGSMPGIESLNQQQYYAHPRNLFWEFMGEMFDFDEALPYQDRLNLLKHNKIALWDVVSECRRKGSLDSNIDISSTEVNDFSLFFKRYTRIHAVFFNGRKSEELFNRFVIKPLPPLPISLNYYSIPSSSPANASMNKQIKFEKWLQIKETIFINNNF